MHVPNLLSALPLLPSTTPHTLLPPRLAPPQPCPPPPQTFALRAITYLRYEVSAPYSSPQPNTTQLVFELENGATGVATGCACQDVMRPDGEWADGGGSLWHACADRALAVGGRDRPVKTSARIEWDAWRLAVNQTWACDESVTTTQFSVLTLAPTCTENKTGSQYIKECTAPDVVVAATSYNSISL